MKRLIFTPIFSVLVFVGYSQVLWDDYDNPGKVVYSFVNGVLNQEFTNPVTTGINTSDTCARYARSTELYDVIVIDPDGTNIIADVADYVSGDKKMSLKIFNPNASNATIQITLEDKNAALPGNYPTGRHSEYTATTTVTSLWETVEFTFANRPDTAVADTSVNRLVILINPNTTISEIFLLDDLMGPEFVDPCSDSLPNPAIAEDFECQRNVTYNFTNGTLIVLNNPLASGLNTSEKCGKFTKYIPPTNDGAFGGDLANPFTTATYKTAHISLYDPSAPSDFLMIFQDASSANLIEKTFTTSSTTEWQEFKMDLSSISSSTQITKYVLLLNPATSTEDSIFLDNFRLSNDVVSIGIADLNNQTKVYPNPSNGKFEIFSNEAQIIKYSVLDNTGRIVRNESFVGKNNASVDMSQLNSGMYSLMVSYENGTQSFHKLVKN